MTGERASVFIVDDDLDVRLAMARLLRMANYEVHTFDSALEFLSRHDPRPPGCIILDVAMPDLNGLQVQECLAASGCSRPVIFLTGVGDIPTSVKAMKAGAVNFLTKPVEEDELFAAVAEALRIDQEKRQGLSRRQIVKGRLESLTPREREVLELGTVEKTVKVHRSRVMQKMGARSVAELVQLASCAGVVSTPPLRAPRYDDFHPHHG